LRASKPTSAVLNASSSDTMMALSPRPVVRSIRLRTARNPGDALIAGRTSPLKKATFSSTLSFLVVFLLPNVGGHHLREARGAAA
jgi:hypothetical protein